MKKYILPILLFALLWPSWVGAATYTIGSGETYTTFTLLVATETLDDNDIVDGKGETFRETWTLDGSGTSGNTIILQNAKVTGADILSTAGWTLYSVAGEVYVSDTFDRSNADTWGTADGGTDADKTWDGGSDFDIAGNLGLYASEWGTGFNAIGDTHTDVDIQGDFASVGANWDRKYGFFARISGGDNYHCYFNPSNDTLYIMKDSGANVLASDTISDPGAAFTVRFQVTGSTTTALKCKAWTGAEPGWDLEVSDSSSPILTGTTKVYTGNAGSGDVTLNDFSYAEPTVSWASTYYKTLATDPGNYVLEDGVLLTKVASIALVEATESSFYWAANVIYVHATGDGDPTSNGKVYETPIRATVIDLNGQDYVDATLDIEMGLTQNVLMGGDDDNNTIKHSRLRFSPIAVNQSHADASANTLYSSLVTDCPYGVYVSAGDGMTVDSNTFVNGSIYWNVDNGEIKNNIISGGYYDPQYFVTIAAGTTTVPDINNNNYFKTEYESGLQHGLHVVLNYYGAGDFRTNALAATISLNPDSVREILSWELTEPTEGNFDWSRVDFTLAAYEAAGIDVMFNIITESPAWANGDAENNLIPDGTDVVANGGFETAGEGGADVFGSWTETASDGAIAQDGNNQHMDDYKALLTAGASVNTQISQTMTVTAETDYVLKIVNAAGTHAGRFLVYDVSNSADIVALKATGYGWGPSYEYFTTPADCISIRVDLLCPGTNAQTAGFDDVVVEEILSSTFTTWLTKYTTWVTAAATRYNGRVTKWEVGNEINYDGFWKPYPEIKRATAWYHSLRDAIKAVNANYEVGFAGIMSYTAAAISTYNGYRFLPDFYTELAVQGGDLPDAIAFHPYVDSNGDPSVHTDYTNSWDDIADLRVVMTDNSDTGDVWLTEWGWAAGTGGEEATAGGYLKYAIESLKSTYTYVTVYHYFMAFDTSPFTNGLFSESGNNFTAKSHAHVFSAFTSPIFNWKTTPNFLALWQASTSDEASSIITDPQFKSTTDFSLKPGSPNRNAAEYIAGNTTKLQPTASWPDAVLTMEDILPIGAYGVYRGAASQ